MTLRFPKGPPKIPPYSYHFNELSIQNRSPKLLSAALRLKIFQSCSFNVSVPRTCSEYKARNQYNSGYYLIDPYQKKGGSTKFNVYCDFENGDYYCEWIVL